MAAHGIPALWQHPTFTSIFLEPFLAVDEVSCLGDMPPMASAFTLVSNLVASLAVAWPSDPTIAAVNRLCKDAWQLSPQSLDSPTKEPCFDFVASFVGRVRALAPGGVLLTPGHWHSTCALIVVVGRSARGHRYELAVCNAGDGVRYHPARADAVDSRPHRLMTLHLRDIPSERVADSSFWVALFTAVLVRGETVGAPGWALVYERLLPYAMQAPLSDAYPPAPPSGLRDSRGGGAGHAAAAGGVRSGRVRWRAMPASGEHRNWLVIIEALRAAILLGPSPPAASSAASSAAVRDEPTDVAEASWVAAERLELLLHAQLLQTLTWQLRQLRTTPVGGRSAAAAERPAAPPSSLLCLSRSQLLFVRAALCRLCNHLGEGIHSNVHEAGRGGWLPPHLTAQLVHAAHEAGALLRSWDAAGEAALPPKLRLRAAGGTASGGTAAGSTAAGGGARRVGRVEAFPFFECMRRDLAAIERAAGIAAKMPIIRPVDFTRYVRQQGAASAPRAQRAPSAARPKRSAPRARPERTRPEFTLSAP